MGRFLISNNAITANGSTLRLAPGASIQVNTSAGTAAVLYLAAEGSTTVANPVTADAATAAYAFYVDDGEAYYNLVISFGGTSATERIYRPVQTGTALPDRPLPYASRADLVAAVSGGAAANWPTNTLVTDGKAHYRKVASGGIADLGGLLAPVFPVTPYHYGAAGDDATDDTTAFQLAAAAGAVFLPNATYIVDTVAISAANVSFRGESEAGAIIKWKGGTQTTDLFSIANTTTTFILENLTIDANKANHTDHASAYYAAVDATLANDAVVKINNVNFTNGRIMDVRLTGPTTSGARAYFDLRNCKFQNGLTSASGRAAQAVQIGEGIAATVVDNRFIQPGVPNGTTEFGRGGVVIQRPTGSTAASWSTIFASGNYFLNVGRSPDSLGAIYGYSGLESCVIIGNTAIDTYGPAFVAKADAQNVIIEGNTVDGNTFAGSGYQDFPSVALMGQQGSYTGTIRRTARIAGNMIRVTDTLGLYVDGLDDGEANFFRNILVQGNNIETTYRAFQIRNAHDITLRGNRAFNAAMGALFDTSLAGTVVLSDNEFTDCDLAARWQGTLTGVTIKIDGNTVTNGQTGSGTIFDIAASPANIFVRNNDVDGAHQWLATVGSSDTTIVEGNTVINATSTWARSGSYGYLWYNHNNTEQDFGFSARTVTIASGAVTAFASWHYVATEGGAATDNLDTINGGTEGQIITLFASSSSNDVVLTDGVGNLRLTGSITLTHADDSVTLIKRGTNWHQISFSDNAA